MTVDSEEKIDCQTCDQAFIHGLPDEILEVIFLINTSKLANESHYNIFSTTLATAQVCQRWRAVALNYPLLWSRIIDYKRHSPLQIETLLARSGSSLIDVDGDSLLEPVLLENYRGKIVLQSIFQRVSSLQTLSLHILRSPWESICRSLLGRPAPNLEFLKLITSCPFPDCFYPDPLFADEAPRLRRLHLRRCLIDFSSSVLFNLTELSVRDVLAPRTIMSVSAHSSHPPSVAGWLRVLKNIPTLRILTLSSAIFRFSEQEPLPVVDLPHLALLTISTRFHRGVTFIDHLNIPPSCGVRFRFYRDSTQSTSRLLSFLSKQFMHLSQDHSDRYLQAKILSDDRIHFGNSKRVGHSLDVAESDELEAHSRYSKDPILSLVLTFDSSDDSFAFFNQLLDWYSFTFSTTTTLDLWLDQEFSGPATSIGSFPSFHSFANVKTLNLLEQSALYLLPLFQNSCQPVNPLFPALQSLYFTGTDMDDELCSVFVAFLLWRAEAQIPIPEIKIISGYISNQTAEDLSRHLRVLLDSKPFNHANTYDEAE